MAKHGEQENVLVGSATKLIHNTSDEFSKPNNSIAFKESIGQSEIERLLQPKVLQQISKSTYLYSAIHRK